MRSASRFFVLLAIASATCDAARPQACMAAGEMSIHRDANGSYVLRIGPVQHISLGAITGAPFTAEEEHQQTQTLGDGTHIVTKSAYHKNYRDSAGRTRTDREILQVRQQPTGLMAFPDSYRLVEVCDPVSQTMFVLDEEHKIVHRYALSVGHVTPISELPHAERIGKLSSPAEVLNGMERDAESLGTDTIEGVTVTGIRTTTTRTAPSVDAGQRIVSTSEEWYSLELGMAILTKNSADNGDSSLTRFVAISRNEPPPNLFEPPGGYSVVDETGAFTMTIHPAKRPSSE